MLDNGSRDGSAEAARAHPAVDELIALRERRGKALQRLRAAAPRARPLRAAAQRGLRAAAGGDARAVRRRCRRAPTPPARAPALRRPRTARAPGRRAWRFPTPLTALAGARCCCTAGWSCRAAARATREVDWCQSAALLVRREAAAAGRLPGPRLLRLLRRGRLRAAPARRRLAQPVRAGRVAIHHEQLSTDAVPERRIVEMSRNRDLYMRKHHSAAAARAVRWLTAWTYALRALAALVLPGPLAARATGATSPRRCARSAARACARPPTSTTARARAGVLRRLHVDS